MRLGQHPGAAADVAPADGWELALRQLAKGEDFAAAARALGRATAEVHTVLARTLPTVTLGHTQVQQLVDGMVERLDVAAQAVPALRPYAPGLRSSFEALAALADHRYLADVKADMAQAVAYGITGVPFYVLDEKYGVSGAQDASVFAQVLAKVAEERVA